MANLETKKPYIETSGKSSFLKKLGSYKFVILGVIAILARNGLDNLAQKLIGDNYTFDEEVPYFEIEEFMSEEEINAMRDYVFKGQRFVTGKDAFSAGVEHIGEAVPVLPDGSCANPDLYNTGNGFCVVPGRYDIGRHFFLTGGLSGSKETYEKLLSSIWSFYQVLPKSFIDTNPMMQKMFKKPEYLKAMNTLCGTNGNDFYFRPLQVNVVVIAPGQDLPLHYDNGWFWGANRFTMPDYLTVAMTTSKLFEDIRIPQAQSVVYLHGSKEKPFFEHGGEYKFWPKGPGGEMRSIRAKRGKAVIMDGGQVPHGGGRINEEYKASNHGQKDAFHRIEYQGNDTWYLMASEDIIDHFTTEQLRLSFVWRGLCFNNKEEADSYETYPQIPIEDILSRFESDLRKRGVLKNGQPRPEPLKFAHMLIDTYDRMPAQNIHGSFTFNYCILSKKFPFLKDYLAPFCVDNSPYKRLNDELPPAKKFCATDGRPSTNCPEQSSKN